MNRRSRSACVAGALLTVLLTAGPASAAYDINGPQEGADPGAGISPLQTIALYLLVPAAIMAVIAAAVLLPGAVRGSRYRPNRGWDAPPMWFAGPPNPAEAVASASTGDITRGGASGSW